MYQKRYFPPPEGKMFITISILCVTRNPPPPDGKTVQTDINNIFTFAGQLSKQILS